MNQSTTISTSAFQWPRLSKPNNIRLMQLEGSNTPSKTLQLALLETSLCPAPKYFAISYAWQGQTPSVAIVVNNHPLLVTPNCEAALKRFHPTNPAEKILLWIDAVCIDQSQDAVAMEERNEQVRMMGEIFGGAEQVWVWLGSRKIDNLDEKYEGVLRWFAELDRAVSSILDFERVRKVRRLAGEVDFHALARIHEVVPWFRRLWMVQEATLAKSTVFFRDEITFRYAPLLTAADIGLARGVGRSVEQVYYTFLDSFRLFYEVSQFLPVINKGRPADLVGFLFYAQKFRTSSPRDKIFALYGLLSRALPDLAPPNYGEDVDKVYRGAAVALLRYSKSLDILNMLHGGRVTPGLASWVPDWACESFPSLPMVGGDVAGEFRATKSSKPEFSISDEGLRLIVKGQIIDTISTCAPHSISSTTEESGDPSQYLSWTRNYLPTNTYWRGLVEKYPHSYASILRLWNICVLQSFIRFAADTDPNPGNPKSRLELYETLCSHTSNYSPKRISQEISAWDGWRDTLMRHDPEWSPSTNNTTSKKSILSTVKSLIIPSPPTYVSGGNFLSTWPAFMHQHWNEDTMLLTPEFAIFEDIAQDPQQAEIHAMLHNSLRYQTLFRTRKGRLGMVCQGVEVGDNVVLLKGVGMPFVVRSVERELGKGNTILAPAFVRGVMEGEAWGMKNIDGKGLEDIVLY